MDTRYSGKQIKWRAEFREFGRLSGTGERGPVRLRIAVDAHEYRCAGALRQGSARAPEGAIILDLVILNSTFSTFGLTRRGNQFMLRLDR